MTLIGMPSGGPIIAPLNRHYVGPTLCTIKSKRWPRSRRATACRLRMKSFRSRFAANWSDSVLDRAVAHNNHAALIDDDWLAESEFADRSRDNIDGFIIQAGIVFVRTQLRQLPLFGLHWATFPGDKEAERVGVFVIERSSNRAGTQVPEGLTQTRKKPLALDHSVSDCSSYLRGLARL